MTAQERSTTTGESGLRGHRIQNIEKAEARRRDILVAAAHVFAREGYTSASLDTIAATIGVTKGVIYYYFRSKEEILTEIRATAIRDAIERLEAIIAAGSAPDVMLRNAVQGLVGHVFDDLDRYANVLRANERLSRESYETVRSLQRRFERLLCGIIEEGIKQGVFADRDAKVTTFTLLRACLGVADWYSPDGPLAPETITHDVVEQVMAGVLCHADTPAT
ncbi:MAG TPA: TetR/AcrR family transcriptional regulator [Dehalococcoidia bacterium]|nr:TetR/AcrR family transcriptional regulator [Dehalococcoidia bacterium]